MNFAFERYTRTASLIGTPESCLSVVQALNRIGVDEIACLIDWLDHQSAMEGLSWLCKLKTLARATRSAHRAIRSHLRQHLPEHMIPSVFVQLPEMPFTPSGKIAKGNLPKPSTLDIEAQYAAPRSPTEAILLDIWSVVLKSDAIGVKDDFFALGGHSLLATQLLTRMRTAFQIDIPSKNVI